MNGGIGCNGPADRQNTEKERERERRKRERESFI